LPASKLSRVLYAFANLQSTGEVSVSQFYHPRHLADGTVAILRTRMQTCRSTIPQTVNSYDNYFYAE